MEALAANRIAWPEGPFDLQAGSVPRAGIGVAFAAGLVLVLGGLGLAALLIALPQQGRELTAAIARLGQGEPSLPALLLFAALGGLLLWTAGELSLSHRLARRGRIVEVDLLRRRMLRRRGAVWQFAYYWQGKRIYGRATVYRDPLILDGTVTRGAALVMGRRHLLLLGGLAPLHLPPGDADRIAGIIAAHFNAERPRSGSSPAMLAAAEPSDWAKRFISAQTDAWNAPDVPQVNAAIEQRHAAAGQAGRREVDVLLQRIRAALPKERPWRG